ncbi:MAG: tRNA (pseudouridine(54)-N(1))-methyltransferase TrmY [Thermoplasmata archaeon]|nr:tRNA (pseudouridine(54)-N(1))-methyltransferase TrmY [Thermoplasmata archaeon]
MRRILLIAHRVPVAGNFTLNDLAGGAGRMDEVARAVSTAFSLSNDLRRDTEMTVLYVASPPPAARRIRLIGERIRYLNPDERSTAALLKNALVRSIPLTGEVEASPGLFVAPADPESELREFARQPGVVWLTESGAPIGEFRLSGGDVGAILADPFDFAPAESALLEGLGVPKVSLGPLSLRSSQCVDLFHHYVDLREAVRPGSAKEAGGLETSATGP